MRSTIPEEVSTPFPIFYENKVIAGFGRGSSELGIPTANLPVDDTLTGLDCGVYFGWCRLSPESSEQHVEIAGNNRKVVFNNGMLLTDQELDNLPMVMSVGWNPFYKNKEKAAEVHIMNKFNKEFYGAKVNLVILGYIRPELNYTTKGMSFDLNTHPYFSDNWPNNQK